MSLRSSVGALMGRKQEVVQRAAAEAGLAVLHGLRERAQSVVMAGVPAICDSTATVPKGSTYVVGTKVAIA